MKRAITILALAFCLSGFAFAQTEWQGRVAKGGSQDFPSEGYYAASNSFPRNTIVSVTNPTTGKTIRVVISRGLTDSSMFMTLSADAARALGLDGNFPATMKAVPVIIPGVSDQSIGAELPFNRDPDVNPAAAAGNSTNTASTSDLSNRTVAQPPNQSLLQSTAQAATSQKAPSAQAASNQIAIPDLNSVAMTNANQTPVTAGSATTDLDLSATTPIGTQPDALPSEILTKGAQVAVSGSPLPVEPSATSANDTLKGQAATGTAGSANLAQGNPSLAGNPTPVIPAVSPEAQALVKATDQAATTKALIPAVMAQVLPASVPGTEPQVAGNSLSGSPAVTGIKPSQTVPTTTAASGQADSGSTISLVPAASSMVDNRAASAGSEPESLVSPSGQNTGTASLLAGVKAGSPRNPEALNAGAGNQNAAIAGGSAIKNGASGIGARTLGTNDVGIRPGATNLEAPQTAEAPAASKAIVRGFGAGVQAFGESNRGQPTIGDIARPEHTFSPPNASANADSAALPLQLPKTIQAGGAVDTVTADAGQAQALLDRQLAAVGSREADRTLFSPAHADDNVSWFPSAQAGKASDPKLSSLPLAGTKEDVKPEKPLNSLKSGVSAGVSAILPAVNPPGGADTRPQGSFSSLSPNSVNPEGLQVPLAKSPDQALPDSSLAGQNPTKGAEISTTLPSAVPGGQSQAEGALGSVSPGSSQIDPSTGLPLAVLPGKDIPDSSNPWLDGAIGMNGDQPSLPIARIVPDDLPQSGLGNAQPGLALVPDKGDLPLVALKLSDAAVQAAMAGKKPDDLVEVAADLPSPTSKGSQSVEDPFAQIRPAETVASLEPADLRPPVVSLASADGGLARTGLPASGNPAVVLSEPGLRSTAGDTGLASQLPPAVGENGEPLLAIANLPGQVSNDGLLDAMRPTPDTGSPDLATPTRTIPETMVGVKSPVEAELPAGNLAQAKTPGQPPAASALSPEANRILALLDQNGSTTPLTTTPTQVVAGADDQWAQTNLPLVKSLQRAKYYVQVGAFANPRSAKTAIEEVATGYQVAVLPEKGGSKPVYKVFVGPLAEDEKGLLLYLFRSKGYRDAFIKQGQP